MRAVEVRGVGLSRFGRHLERSLGSLADEASGAALEDAQSAIKEIDAVVFSNAAQGIISGQEMIRGQVALKGTDLAGLPVVNTENACASGGSALHLAWLMVASAQADSVIAVGAEKLHHEDKQRSFKAIESGTDLSLPQAGPTQGSVMMGAYAQRARRYAEDHSVDVEEALARIAVKNRGYACANPYAQFREPISTDDVAASREVAAPLRLLTCSPLSDGAAAVIVSASGPGLRSRPGVRIASTVLASHGANGRVVSRASQEALLRSGRTVDEVDVWQLHDASAHAELEQYEDVGLAGPGQAMDVVRRAADEDGIAVNTDGGLLSRGHPLGATGLAQVGELTLQLQGRAQGRQVGAPTVAMAVNAGGWMGDDYGAAVATVLERT